MGISWTEQLKEEIEKYIKNLERFESRFEDVDEDYKEELHSLKRKRKNLAQEIGVPEKVNLDVIKRDSSFREPIKQYIEGCSSLYERFTVFFKKYFVGEDGDGRVDEFSGILSRINFAPDPNDEKACSYIKDNYWNLYALLWASGITIKGMLSSVLRYKDVLTERAWDEHYDVFNRLHAEVEKTGRDGTHIFSWPTENIEPIFEGVVIKDTSDTKNTTSTADADDPMYEEAVKVVVAAGCASTSLLQIQLKLGYARAARLIDIMEENGVVGPYEGAKPRRILSTSSAAPKNTFTTDSSDDLKKEVSENLGLNQKIGEPVVAVRILDKQLLNTILNMIEDKPDIDLPEIISNLRKDILKNNYQLEDDFDDFTRTFRRKKYSW